MKKIRVIDKRFAEPSQLDKNQSSLQRDEWLENIAVGFRSNDYVMDQFIPELSVKKDSAKYRVYSSKGRFKAVPRRGETALPEQSALQYSEDSYLADEIALSGYVSDDSIQNAANDLDPLADEAEYLAERIWLTNELYITSEILTAIKSAGTDYYNNLTAGTKWLGGANADVLGDISSVIKIMAARIGKRPNKLAMSTDVLETIIHDTKVVDVLKRASTALVTDAKIINQLRGMPITLADAVVNIGEIENQTMSNILYDIDTVTPLKNFVVFAYVKNRDKLTLGTNFVPMQFKAYRGRGVDGDLRRSTIVAVYKKLAPKVTNVGAGYLIGSVLG